KRIAALEAELDTLRAELAALDPAAAAVPVAAPPESAATWPLFVALALVLAGFGVLAMGDLSTLLPRRRPVAAPSAPRAEAGADGGAAATAPVDDVPALARHASAGRWKDGLACAGRIAIEQLHKLEMLDYLYLRAFCGVMAVAAPEGGAPPPHEERKQ